MIELKFHFDGKTIVLDEPVNLPINVPLTAKMDEPVVDRGVSAPKVKRVFGQFRDQIRMSPDFDDPLPEEFWDCLK